MKYRYLLSSLIFFAFLTFSSAQLSFLSVMDSFPGSESEFVPLAEGFMTLNASFENNDDYAFRLTRFDKCGTLEWAKDYVTEDLFYHGFGAPEVVSDNTGSLYIILTHGSEQGEGVILSKLNTGGSIEWSHLLHGTASTNKSGYSNILYDRYSDTLAITINTDQDNAAIIRFDKDGSLLEQVNIPGFNMHSSQIASDGGIVMANDTAIVKVDENLQLVWAKRLNSHSTFVQSNDPYIELNGQVNIMAVDTFGTELDSFYYSLITLDEDGNLYANSERVRGTQFGSVDLQNRGSNTFAYLDRTYLTYFEGNTNSLGDQMDYAFCADTIPYVSSNMNTCIDNSLLFSGFYYEKTDSIQFFMGKTDPMAALNCNEEKVDSFEWISRANIVMDSIHFEIESFTILQDTVEFEIIEQNPEQEIPCFTAILEDQSQEFFPCPCEPQALSVTWHKSAEYLWDNGETSTSIVVDTTGVYTVNVNLCGTEQESVFNVDYKELSECMQFFNESPLCPGLETTLGVIHGYDDRLELSWSTGESGDSINVTSTGSYIVDMEACGFTDSYTFDVVYKSLEEEECIPVKIPNAFVPNSSMYEDNKVFKIYTKLEPEVFTHFHMVIFDRWGEKVYESNDPTEGWNGTYNNKAMSPGVYLYGINYELDLGGDLYSQSFDGQVILIK